MLAGFPDDQSQGAPMPRFRGQLLLLLALVVPAQVRASGSSSNQIAVTVRVVRRPATMTLGGAGAQAQLRLDDRGATVRWGPEGRRSGSGGIDAGPTEVHARVESGRLGVEF